MLCRWNQKWTLCKIVTTTLSSLILLGCGVELQDKNQPNNVNLGSGVLLSFLEPSQFSAKAVGLNTPNVYHVQLTWPKAKGKIRIYDESKLKAEISAAMGAFVDQDVRAGSVANYKIEFMAENEASFKTWPWAVQIPLDVLLEGPMTMSEAKVIEAERIFLAKSLQLYTRDYDLTLKARVLIADDGSISNFSSLMSAEKGMNGKSGGVVRILAQYAQGSLHVMLNGEDVGPRAGGALFHPDGDQGERNKSVLEGGAPGKLLVEIQKENRLVIDVQEVSGSSVPHFELF